MKSVYQSEEYKEALICSGIRVVDVSEGFFAVERDIKLPFFGKKKIIESRGAFARKDIEKFKEVSKKYFYGTIAPTVVNYLDEDFKEMKFKKVSNFTILLDLSRSEDELWKSLDKGSIRWGVNFAKKNGLKFEVADKAEIDQFYRMYESTAKDGGFKPEPMKFIDKLCCSSVAKLFIVKKDKSLIAGGLVLFDKKDNYSILDLTSSSAEGLKLQAMPFLYWNIILFSKSLGLKCFDLGGYDKEARESEKTYKINKFKERFGGEIKVQPIYASNKKYSLLRSILRKARFMKKTYEKN